MSAKTQNEKALYACNWCSKQSATLPVCDCQIYAIYLTAEGVKQKAREQVGMPEVEARIAALEKRVKELEGKR